VVLWHWVQRWRCSAILAADVAGYNRLAASGEQQTLARLRVLIDPIIAVHGRVLHSKRLATGLAKYAASLKG